MADRTMLSNVDVPETSIVLPVHNQADHLERVMEHHLDMLKRLGGRYELVLVSNNCQDETPRICAELSERHASITAIDLADGGWGRAVKAGLAVARGDVLGYTNSARTKPEMLAIMLSYARAYPDVVLKANRRIRESWQRRLGSVLYNLECRALFDLATWDINGTPKVFPRRFSALLELRRDDDLIDAEFMQICRQQEYPVLEVPLLETERHGGRSTTNLESAFKMYRGALALKRQSRGR
jgi:glycosyltransferase involved in cell wall biosynthesis